MKGTVIRSGYGIITLPPTQYWSAELDGLVSSHEAATFYGSQDQAQAVIDARGLNRVCHVKPLAEILLDDDSHGPTSPSHLEKT